MKKRERSADAAARPRAAQDAGDARSRTTAAEQGHRNDLEHEDDERDTQRDSVELTREDLEHELETARAEIERLQDQSLRRQAELVNFRRRAQKEQAELAAVAQARLLEGLVPVIDDFERAVDVESDDARAYREGMQLIVRRVQKTLEEIGVERLEPLGQPFDPRYHEAIARQETDEAPAGQVLDVYQPGYRLRDRLIRPAAVVVAYGSEPAEVVADSESVDAADDVAAGEDDGGRDDG